MIGPCVSEGGCHSRATLRDLTLDTEGDTTPPGSPGSVVIITGSLTAHPALVQALKAIS